MDKKDNFPEYISYLQRSDFDNGNKGLVKFEHKPCVMLIASEKCGHCVHFKPTFVKTAKKISGGRNISASKDNKDCYFAVIMASGKDCDEELKKFLFSSPDFLKRNNIDIRGYPTILLRTTSGKYIEYDGKRTEDDFENWIQTNKNK